MKRKVVKVDKIGSVFTKLAKSKLFYTGLAICVAASVSYNAVTNKIDDIKNHSENTYGYEDITPGDFIHSQSNTFVLLDAGDYNTKGSLFFDEIIDYCKKNNMSVGIVINEKENNYDAIYRDVELAKNIISKHNGNIDLPIFFNVDSIIENYNLMPAEKSELIMTFLSKCESNGIFVSLYGKDLNLTRFKSVCDNVSNYNSCVVCDNEDGNIRYDGPCNFIKYPNGTIKTQEDFSKYIIGKSLNTIDKFVTDSVYTVSEGEHILDIAFKFNITPRDLLNFNNIKEKDIVSGKVLRIPSVLGKYAPYEKGESKLLNDPLVGADISNHNYNEFYNPDKLANNFDFIILKATEGVGWDDKSFDIIAKDCFDRDIPIGAYVLNTITDINLSEDEIRDRIVKQTDYFLNKIANKKIDYPVYLDLEGNSANMILNTPEKFKIMLEVWNEKISNAGYIPGLYMNTDMYKNMINNSEINNDSFDVNSIFEMWIAGGKHYLTEDKNSNYLSTSYNIDDVKPRENELEVETVQPTNVGDGLIYGAANSFGKLDIDFSYKDYTSIELPENVDYEILNIMEPNQLPDARRVGLSLGGFAFALAGGMLIHRKVKRMVR